MPAPSASTIARVGAQHAALTLPETATVQRVTRTPNDSGGWTETTATVATVAARVAPAGGSGARNAEGRIEVTDQWWLTFPSGTDVDSGDRVTINGRVFNVDGPDGGRSYEITRRVIGTEVT